MDDATEELTRLVDLVSPGWRNLGAPRSGDLPTDYWELAERFGSGCFNTFLWLWVPGCPNQYLDLDRQRDAELHNLRACAAQGEDVPAVALGDSPALIPWAGTDNGDTLWWLPTGEDPDTGRVLVSAVRPMEWETYQLSCSRLLTHFVAGALGSDILINDFGAPGFVPWDLPTRGVAP